MSVQPNTPRPEWIDADAHVLEPGAVWNYLDKEYRSRVELIPVTEDGAFNDIRIDGLYFRQLIMPRETHFSRWVERFNKQFVKGSGSEAGQYLKDLDLEGLDKVVIYPTVFLFAPWLPQIEATFAAAMCRAYNDWAYDFASADRRRLKPAAVLPIHDVELAIKEAKRCAERDFVAAFIRPNPLRDRTVGHPDYHPLYQVLADLGISLGLHEGNGVNLPQLGRDRTKSQWGIHMMSHPFELMAAMLSMIEYGVLEKFPKLKVLYLEGGTAMWLPYWLNRLDVARKHPGRAEKTDALLPSELFTRQCYVTCEVDDPYLPQTISCIGDTNMLLSTDYPHLESPYPNSMRTFLEQPISAESRARIGTLNAKAAYPRL